MSRREQWHRPGILLVAMTAVLSVGPASWADIVVDISKAVGTGDFATNPRQTTDGTDYLNLSVLEPQRAHGEDHILVGVNVIAGAPAFHQILISARTNDGDKSASLMIENLTNGSFVAFRTGPTATGAADDVELRSVHYGLDSPLYPTNAPDWAIDGEYLELPQ